MLTLNILTFPPVMMRMKISCSLMLCLVIVETRAAEVDSDGSDDGV